MRREDHRPRIAAKKGARMEGERESGSHMNQPVLFRVCVVLPCIPGFN